MCARGPKTLIVPSTTENVLGFSVFTFHPSNVLPSNIFTHSPAFNVQLNSDNVIINNIDFILFFIRGIN